MKLTAALFCAPVLFFAACAIPDHDTLSAQSVQTLAEQGVEQGLWPGIMWAEIAPGRVISTGAAGFADVDTNTPMTAQTLMPIGSISKVIVGLAAAHAIDAGQLDPHAPLSDYMRISVDAPDGQDRTFVQLATHRSGIRDADKVYEGKAYHIGDTTHPVPLRRFLADYVTQSGQTYDARRNFGPWEVGSRYHYSNIASALAAIAIEDATGADFAQYSDRTVTQKLGLSGDWGHRLPAATQRATLYEEGSGFTALPDYGLATWPDGQYNASAQDLGRLLATITGRGVLDGQQRLTPAVVDQLVTPRVTSAGATGDDPSALGLFWSETKLALPNGTYVVEGHDGSDPGVFTMMYFVPKLQKGFVIMTNAEPNGRRAVIQLAYMIDALL